MMMASDIDVKGHRIPRDSGVLSSDSVPDTSAEDLSTIRGRIRHAMAEERREGRPVERELQRRGVLSPGTSGYMSRLLSGDRNYAEKMGIDVFVALADILHVSVEWLATGTGTMRRGGRVRPTAFEGAMIYARSMGCREDAIQQAWEENKDKSEGWTEDNWRVAINYKALTLNQTMPRPEEIDKKQGQIRRQKRKKARVEEASEPAKPESVRGRRVSGR